MAVTLSTTHPLYYATLFGCSDSIIQKAQSVGLVINSSTLGMLKVVDPQGSVYGTIQVKGSALTLAKNGNMGPASKQVIQHQLEKALVAGINANGENAVSPATIDTTGMSAGQKAALTKAMKTVELVAPGSLVQAKIHKPAESLLGQVKLSNAKTLYEPVAGSTSVYRVIAMYPGLNIAMRRTPFKISLRAEGPNLSSHIKKLASLGFDDHDGYASVHLDVTNSELTQKTVGALFGLLGFSTASALGEPLKIEVEV